MKHRAFTPRQKYIVFALLALVIAAFFAAGYFVGRPLVRFASQPERFRAWVEGFGPWGGAAYGALVALQVLAALIPGEPLEICGGYAFGAVAGTLWCLLGAMAGSILVFSLVRRFGRPLVELFFARETLDKLRFLHASPRRDLLFAILFILPGTPKDLLCYFAGLTDLRWSRWLWICSVGRLPSILTSTLGGSSLGEENYPRAALVFLITAALSASGLWLYRRLRDKHE